MLKDCYTRLAKQRVLVSAHTQRSTPNSHKTQQADARLLALITISTRASLKRYHDYQLTLGLGDDASGYELVRIGTKTEKESVEKELQELREALAQVEQLKQRRQEIDEELNKVWTVSSRDDDEQENKELDAPSYHDGHAGDAS